jgi:phage-related protein
LSAERRLAYDGKMFRIAFARDHNGSYPAEEFFDQLPIADRVKLEQRFRILGDLGKHSNPEMFGDLGDGLYEFKSFQIRMPYAYASERGLVLITHGFRKKKDKTPPAEIASARKILSEDAEASTVFVISDQNRKRRRP